MGTPIICGFLTSCSLSLSLFYTSIHLSLGSRNRIHIVRSFQFSGRIFRHQSSMHRISSSLFSSILFRMGFRRRGSISKRVPPPSSLNSQFFTIIRLRDPRKKNRGRKWAGKKGMKGYTMFEGDVGFFSSRSHGIS